MTAVLAVPKKVSGLQREGWVRIKRGTYKGDIAQVVEMDETRGRVVVKLIPRLDPAKGKEKEVKEDDGEKKK
jgi:transcription elongation factor SPT5